MFLDPRINAPARARITAMLPWVFIVGVAVGTTLPWRKWVHHRYTPGAAIERPWPDFESEIFWERAGQSNVPHPVDVLRTIDGDTFLARVHLKPGLNVVTRVRLRGIDAPELKAACARELRMAEAATDALRTLLDDGDVTITNVGPDKYAGRVDADAATAHIANVSNALLATGWVRRYDGGRRNGWCSGRS